MMQVFRTVFSLPPQEHLITFAQATDYSDVFTIIRNGFGCSMSNVVSMM